MHYEYTVDMTSNHLIRVQVVLICGHTLRVILVVDAPGLYERGFGTDIDGDLAVQLALSKSDHRLAFVR